MQTYSQALVLGLGGSGGAAAALLRAEGSAVTVVDRVDTPELRTQAAGLEALGVCVRLGAAEPPNAPFDVAVVSPGLPVTSPWVLQLAQRGVPIVPELEFGWSRRRGRAVAITGSNGKSTAVKWFSESLQHAGLRAAPAGNYGPAVSKVVAEQPDLDWLVLEVSTFQMETARDFRPDVGILLNIFPNHLDRHRDMQTYTTLKARMFARTREGDACIVHEDWCDAVRRVSGGGGRWISFGSSESADYRYANGFIARGGTLLADLRGTRFANEVLGLAGAAVVAGLEACGIAPEHAVAAARTFDPLPHRMQTVATIRGVGFVNDSKATNLTAMAAALRMIDGKARLIAGGLVKEKDFSFVKEVLAKKAVGVYLIGQASEEMASAWSDIVPCFRCGTLDAAVKQAGDDARAGETVLLSPACASFDQFRNFEQRGERFCLLVQQRVEEDAK